VKLSQKLSAGESQHHYKMAVSCCIWKQHNKTCFVAGFAHSSWANFPSGNLLISSLKLSKFSGFKLKIIVVIS